MPTITYPSALVPAPPRIRIDVPHGWEQLDLPQTVLAARETGLPEGDFATNVTVRHLVRPATTSEATLIAELRDFVGGKAQGVISDAYQTLINGTEVHGANLSYVDPVAGTLAQVHVFARRAHGQRSSVVQLVATFSGGRAEQLGHVVHEIVQSLQIEWPPREPAERSTANH
jgi:hypothetical protein